MLDGSVSGWLSGPTPIDFSNEFSDLPEAHVGLANTETSMTDPKTFLSRLHQEAIAPNADTLATILQNGDVALLFFEVSADATVAAAARSLGWRGGRVEVARFSPKQREELAASLATTTPTDPAITWLRAPEGERLFVVAQSGTLCVNFAEAEGFSIAPGTANGSWMN